jgi:hypothetical protein
MRLARIRFTIRRLMTVVAVSALVLAPFAWLPLESRWPLLIGVLTVGSMLLILASPFLIDWLERRQKLGPRDNGRSGTGTTAARAMRSPRMLRFDDRQADRTGAARTSEGQES